MKCEGRVWGEAFKKEERSMTKAPLVAGEVRIRKYLRKAIVTFLDGK